MPNDIVNHPSHYTDGSIEVIDFIEFWGLGFHLGNAVKYISRAGKKDPDKKIEDLEKALWYIRRAAGVPREYRVFNAVPHYIQEGRKTISALNYCTDKGIEDTDLQLVVEDLTYLGNQDDILELAAERLDKYIEKLKEASK